MKAFLAIAVFLSGCAVTQASQNWNEIGVADGGSIYTSVNEVDSGGDIQMVFYFDPTDQCRVTTMMMIFSKKRYDPVAEYAVTAEMKVDDLGKWAGDDTRAAIEYSNGLSVARLKTYFGKGSELFLTELSEGRKLHFRWKQNNGEYSATSTFSLTGSKAVLGDAFGRCRAKAASEADLWGDEDNVIW